MIDLDKVIVLLEENYYILVLLFICEIAAVLFAAKNLATQFLGRFFIFYLSLDALILVLDILIHSVPTISNSFKIKFVTASNIAIGLTELLVYFSFFQQILENRKTTKVLGRIQILFSFLSAILIIFTLIFPYKFIDYPANLLGVFEFLLLIPPCILYFQKILNTESNLTLFSRPSFWITAGVFFYSASAIPYYLIKKYMNTIHYPYRSDIATAFFYTPIIINIIFLILAFRWKKPITI